MDNQIHFMAPWARVLHRGLDKTKKYEFLLLIYNIRPKHEPPLVLLYPRLLQDIPMSMRLLKYYAQL